MNRYRAYMDRIHAPSGLRYRVLEAAERGERPRRTPHRWIRAGALAACLVLVCTGIAGVHAALWPDPTAGVAETPAVTAASPAPAETALPALSVGWTWISPGVGTTGALSQRTPAPRAWCWTLP